MVTLSCRGCRYMVSCLLAMLMMFAADRRCMVLCLIVLMFVADRRCKVSCFLAMLVVVERLEHDRNLLFCFCHLMRSLIVVVTDDQVM